MLKAMGGKNLSRRSSEPQDDEGLNGGEGKPKVSSAAALSLQEAFSSQSRVVPK